MRCDDDLSVVPLALKVHVALCVSAPYYCVTSHVLLHVAGQHLRSSAQQCGACVQLLFQLQRNACSRTSGLWTLLVCGLVCGLHCSWLLPSIDTTGFITRCAGAADRIAVWGKGLSQCLRALSCEPRRHAQQLTAKLLLPASTDLSLLGRHASYNLHCNDYQGYRLVLNTCRCMTAAFVCH